jgi:hypothetical protein
MGQERRGIAGGMLAGIAVAGVGAAGAAAWLFAGLNGAQQAPARAQAAAGKPAATAPEAKAPVSESDGLAAGSPDVLRQVIGRLGEKSEDKPGALPRALLLSPEEYVAILEPTAAGFAKFDEADRRQILTLATQALKRFAPEGAPENWFRVLPAVESLFSQGIDDPSAKVRTDALAHAGLYGSWFPGRSLASTEEEFLTGFKVRLGEKMAARLADSQPLVRATAVAALGAQPTRRESAPGTALLADPNPTVRCQVLLSYANRPDVLDDEKILPLLMDSRPEVVDLAEKALKGRGRTPDQIGMGRLLYHPNPEMRASAISMLEMKADAAGLDREIWLLHLSRDPDASVRLKAIEALCKDAATVAVRKRLEEMSLLDGDPKVREAAKAGVGAEVEDVTATLPPLPGTPGLAPTAN